jgi:hypothetical protein
MKKISWFEAWWKECVCVQMCFGMTKLVLGFDAKYPLGVKQAYRFIISEWFLERLKLDSYAMISIEIIFLNFSCSYLDLTHS